MSASSTEPAVIVALYQTIRQTETFRDEERALPAARQSEHPFREDVAQHLGCARFDSVRARAQELVLPAVAIADLSRRARDVDRGFGHLLVELRPHEFQDRAFGAGDPIPLHGGDGAVPIQLQRAGLDGVFGDLLADQRVRTTAQLAGVVGELGGRDLRSRRQGHPQRAPLMKKGRHGDRPTVAGLAQDLRLRHLHVLEEDLVELGVAGDLDQRPDLDAGALHVDDQVGEAVARVDFLALAGDEHAPLRYVRECRPDLLPVDQVVVAFVLGARLQARQVAARVGLAEALAPDLLGRQKRREVAFLLLVGAVGDHDRAAHPEADDVDRLRRVGQDHLVVEDQLVHEGAAAAAVLLGPGDADVAGVVELLLPRAAAFDEGLHVAGAVRVGVARGVGLQPGPDLVAEFLLGVAELEVHASGAYSAIPGLRVCRSSLRSWSAFATSLMSCKASPSSSRKCWSMNRSIPRVLSSRILSAISSGVPTNHASLRLSSTSSGDSVPSGVTTSRTCDARSRRSAWLRPMMKLVITERLTVAGSRPISRQQRSSSSRRSRNSSGSRREKFHSAASRATSGSVRFEPLPPMSRGIGLRTGSGFVFFQISRMMAIPASSMSNLSRCV